MRRLGRDAKKFEIYQQDAKIENQINLKRLKRIYEIKKRCKKDLKCI